MNKAMTPEEIFPDGQDHTDVVNPFTGFSGKARKATVAATLHNIALLDDLLPESVELKRIESIDEEIRKLIPSLKAIGIFDLFTLEEWVNDELKLGRIYVIILYLKHYPEEMTDSLAFKLEIIKNNTKSAILRIRLQTSVE